MSSRVKKSRSSLLDEELRYSLQKETTEERLDEVLENVSLKNVSQEERRREAQKPLFQTRYEQSSFTKLERNHIGNSVFKKKQVSRRSVSEMNMKFWLRYQS